MDEMIKDFKFEIDEIEAEKRTSDHLSMGYPPELNA